MILGDVMVPGKSLRCDACGWPWISISKDLPEACPNRACRSRQWNGPKKRIRPTRIELPKPQRIEHADEEFDF
jgi:hypothetical protein